MIQYFKIIFAILFLPLLQQNCKKKVDTNCNYSYEHSTSQIKWTAYKFTTRAGVSGVFDQIKATGTTKATTPGAVFENMVFSIPTNSVNSKNEGRDKKIRTSFFATMTNTSTIKGKILSIDHDVNGKAIVNLTINTKTKEVPFSFTTSQTGEFIAKANIDLADWDALASIKALNKVCAQKHSKDGISKLWPDVEIEIKSQLKKSCKN